MAIQFGMITLKVLIKVFFNERIQQIASYVINTHYLKGVEITGENWLERTVVPSELRKKVLHQARFKTLTSIRFFQVKNKAFIHTLTESMYL